MKLLFILLMVAAVALVGFQFGKETVLAPPLTTVRVEEGSVRIYYRTGPGDKEFLGIYEAGESIEVRPQNRGPFAMLNLIQYMIPKAVALFKTNVAKFSKRPSGLITYPFTEYEFDQQCVSKMRNSLMPDLRVALHKDGYTATGTLMLPGMEIPFSSTGFVGVDPAFHGRMYAKLYEVKLGNYSFPRAMLDRFEENMNRVMERGEFHIEIRDMQYRDGRIDITYYKYGPSYEDLEDREAAYFYKPTPEKIKNAIVQFFSGQRLDDIKKFFTS